MTQYIADEAHFKEVIARVPEVKKYLWIGTADIKDLYVEEKPFLGVLAGILTDEPDLVDAAINHFDSVWAGFKCENCGRKEYCPDPIIDR